MKIQAITNTNFKGLFSNKTNENGGNWRMEYAPYSWESSNSSKMAPKERLDLFSPSLPDNEEIYTKNATRESSKDILGTESYFRDFSNGKMRKTITEVQPLTREESLKVRDKKLDKLLEMQKNLKTISEAVFVTNKKDIQNENAVYNKNSKTYDLGYFDRDYTKDAYKRWMDDSHNKILGSSNETFANIDKYITLRDSMDKVRDTKLAGLEEIGLLEKARLSGNLIDISVRTIHDPNKALWDALQNMKAASGKLVALPHKTLSVQEILKAIGQKVKSADIPSEAIRYIDTLIKRGI